ncbi:MAG: hypothetical protein AAF493_07735 [Pseudomonadota bacterium]
MTQQTTLACTLTPDELCARREEVRAALLPHVVGITPLSNGVRIAFAPADGLRERVDAFIALENDCCAFLTLTATASAGGLLLEVTGPPEAAGVIEMFRGSADGAMR